MIRFPSVVLILRMDFSIYTKNEIHYLLAFEVGDFDVSSLQILDLIFFHF